jgi:hypothetical protein
MSAPVQAPPAPPGAAFRDDVPAAVPPTEDERTVRKLAVVRVGVLAALAGWAAMVFVLALVSEIASQATWKPGVDSSTWTPFTGVSAFLLGIGAYDGDFAILSILFGLLLLAVYAVFFGVIGVALIVLVQGPRPGWVGATAQGIGWALFLEIYGINLVINSIQGDHLTVYDSLPSWGWWAAHAAYGATLGLTAARVLPSGFVGALVDPKRP